MHVRTCTYTNKFPSLMMKGAPLEQELDSRYFSRKRTRFISDHSRIKMATVQLAFWSLGLAFILTLFAACEASDNHYKDGDKVYVCLVHIVRAGSVIPTGELNKQTNI